ncbi:MAG TPA: hypothetical protein PLX15_00550 [Candidatus Woesearchaeota archaeon]|jgi:hypothetical protein|nr:hypothetical protein [Candidatus Woesearchaeota archaeon]
MAKKVARVGVKKEKGFLYFVNKNGDVARVPMARGKNVKRGKAEVVAKPGVKKETGFLYFIDKDGDVAQAKMARGRKRR